jgi:hypothetical protein
MPLANTAFTPTREQEDRDNDKSVIFTIRLNEEEQAKIEWSMNFLQQDQRSKAIKQLVDIAYNVLQDQKIDSFREVLFKNIINNNRRGIHIVEGKIKRL